LTDPVQPPANERPWLLPVLMLSGATLGFLVGGVFGSAWSNPRYDFIVELIALLGELFLNMLKMIVIPLIVASMIVGITSLGDLRKIRGTLGFTLSYYVMTTLLSVALGIFLVLLINPGAGVDTQVQLTRSLPEQTTWYSALFDVFRGMVPSNLFKAAAEGQVLGLIFASLMFGGILTTMGERGRRVIDLIATINEAIMRIVRLVIWLAPIGIFGLVATKIGQAGGGPAVAAELARIAKYAFTVILGLFIHATIILPTLLFFLAKKSPIRYASHYTEALLTAFTTASSAASLPITMRDARKNAGLSEKAAGFVLPLGATVNMDGTALYEAVAVIFICQAYGIELGAAHFVVIWLTATLAAIGAAAIPEAGLVTMVMVLIAVGAPTEGIALLLAIDWFLDRCRTTVNVWGDSIGAAIIDRRLESNKQK
jgi:solute carrier family 1 (neuronal/epithelial high affinity glutamate transporter), member 1